MFKTSGFADPIITHQLVDRKTEKSVWVNGRRHGRHGGYESYFDTFLEAKAHLMTLATSKCNVANTSMQRAKKYMDMVKALEEV